jgi:hypothetical protein
MSCFPFLTQYKYFLLIIYKKKRIKKFSFIEINLTIFSISILICLKEFIILNKSYYSFMFLKANLFKLKKKMYSLIDLKEKIELTDKSVECPIKNCEITVERQRKSFKKNDVFKCPVHNIYISPSTYEYKEELDNTLWKDEESLLLFKNIKTVKRESRISRENSEDAVTWNVFRYLEANNLIDGLLSELFNEPHRISEIIYWSYSQKGKSRQGWVWLNNARFEFGEMQRNGSEPDIIIISDNTLFFIEAKLQSNNNTKPRNLNNSKKYTTGGNNWFTHVFNSDYKTIVYDGRKYELMRFWLIGTWIAKKLNLKFHLVNLVLSGKEMSIVMDFGKYIKTNSQNKFSKLNWEDIYNYIDKSKRTDTELIINYFKYKSAGFTKNGKIRKRFKINNCL